MKHTIKYLILCAGLLLTNSCEDWMSPKPLDKMVVEDYWKVANDVESVVLTMYAAMTEDAFMERIIIAGEARSDEVTIGENDEDEDLLALQKANISYTNTYIKWGAFYKVINYCNTVLKYAPQVNEIDPNYSTGKLHVHQAEALTIRALVYFYLVRIYKEIPFVTEPTIDDTQNFAVAATPTNEILAQLEEDLKLAEQYAVISWGTYDSKGRVTKNVARTLLADIYLWQDKFQDCIDVCDKVLQSEVLEADYRNSTVGNWNGSELVLMSDEHYNIFSELFYTGNSLESIFELQFLTSSQSNTKLKSLYGIGTNDGSNDLTGKFSAPVQLLTDLFTSNKTDIRALYTFTDKSPNYSYICKYVTSPTSIRSSGQVSEDPYLLPNAKDYYISTSKRPNNWIIYRLSDVILMKAESLVEREKGASEADLRSAFELVYKIWKRSNPDATADETFTSALNSYDAMWNRVLKERHREFAYEGKRWFDLMRVARRHGNSVMTEFLNKTHSAELGGFNAKQAKLSIPDALYLPIHRDELISNPQLKQNPAYENILQ